MLERTPLRERPLNLRKRLPIVYSVEGVEENRVIKEVESFEDTLQQLDKNQLITALGICSSMSQDEIKERILTIVDISSSDNDIKNGDDVDE